MKNLTPQMFVVALCIVSCLLGMAAAHNNAFPYTVVRDASTAAEALIAVYTSKDEQLIDDKLEGPTVRNGAAIDDGCHFLVAGGLGFHPDKSSTGHSLAWLMDRSGKVEHVWEFDPKLWDDVTRVSTVPLKSTFFPVGLHLEADGSLLANFQGKETFPYGVGIAKFDRNSNLIWKKELLNHHWFSVGDDGRIYVPSVRTLDAPYRIGDSIAAIQSKDGKILDDTILTLSPDGEVLQELSMLECLVASGFVGLYQGATDDNVNAITSDPVHLNDVRIITEEMAREHSILSPGDLLVSFRSLNLVGILDPNTKKFKWVSSGLTLRQHSPRIYDGGILLLDNRGGALATGGSRLVKLEFDSPTSTTIFPNAAPGKQYESFFTQVAGHLSIGIENRLLVTLTTAGEIWEVDLNTGEVLWDYVYVDPQTRARKPIYTAKYVYDIGFPMNLQ